MATGKVGSRAVASIAFGVCFMAVFFMTLLAPGLADTAMARDRDRIVLEFEDRHIRSNRGEWETLHLKRMLREQYPWVEVDNLDLRRVVLIAKSRHGRGEAQLRVGNRTTEVQPVPGHPGEFRDDRRYTFDRVNFSNPSHGSNGPWQLDLQGNLIVRKVVLEVVDRPHHRYSPRPSRF